MEWNSLSLFNTDPFAKRIRNPLYWTLKYPFSDDLLAGLLAAGCLYISYVEKENNDYDFRVGGARNYQLAIKELSHFDREYVPYQSVRQDEVEDVYPDMGKYGIWIISQADHNRWDFITFTNVVDFMRGFISMSIGFRVDFRNYILGPPYNSDGTEYDVEGYNIPPYFTEEEDEEDEYDLDD
ncbi:Hypothetical protein HVR_LOCUS1148 [uncultured virus]|nr:Hypothetical protein HVR_LOCUS1148 [uncultured virus]